MLSQEAIEKILGIEEKTPITPEEMAGRLNITFYPYEEENVSRQVAEFAGELREALTDLKVNIVPYEEAFEKVLLKKTIRRFFLVILNDVLYALGRLVGAGKERQYIELAVLKNVLRRYRIKAGISVVATGENETGDLPMDKTSSFRESSVITILDIPEGIDSDSEFHKHFDAAMSMFAYNMTNIVIAVDDEKWILYNFNASHPSYPRKHNFKKHILEAFVPKVAAPVRPHRFKDFSVLEERFDVGNPLYAYFVDDIIEGGALLEKAGIYPPGKKIDDLPFRNNFYRWIGKIHLDNRSGMSYGFLAWQLPSELSHVFPAEETKSRYGVEIPENKDIFYAAEDLFIKVHILGQRLCLKVPKIWVLSQRSGSDKTHIKPERDIVKIGLKNGRMYLQAPSGLKLNDSYKPSFDTKVMLAHAVGNAIAASILKHCNPKSEFARRTEKKGIAMGHWHGYFNPKKIPQGWSVYGFSNPHVACSTPQSAVYALSGKLRAFINSQDAGRGEYMGDIHIEPHHGTNICFTSLKDLGKVLKEPEVTDLGNKYLKTD